jgi:hypothetical protein
MIPRIPYIFADGETLSTRKIKDNLLRLHKDLEFSSDRNLNTSQFMVDFTGIAAATAQALRTYRFRAAANMVIIGLELIVQSNAANAFVSLSSPTPNITGLSPVTVSCSSTDPVGTTSYGYKDQRIALALGSAPVDFVVNTSGNIGSCKIVVHYRASRYIKRSTIYTFNPELDSTTNLSTAASRLNSSFSAWATQISNNEAANLDVNYEVYRVWNDAASPLINALTLIPSEGRVIDRLAVSVVCAAGTTLKAEIKADAGIGAVLSTVSQAGINTGTLAESFTDVDGTETGTDVTDAAQDLQLEIVRTAGAATILSAYVTIVWK